MGDVGGVVSDDMSVSIGNVVSFGIEYGGGKCGGWITVVVDCGGCVGCVVVIVVTLNVDCDGFVFALLFWFGTLR